MIRPIGKEEDAKENLFVANLLKNMTKFYGTPVGIDCTPFKYPSLSYTVRVHVFLVVCF